MKHLENNKRLFLDMQEHPEKYSDEQLETMMDDIDRVVDPEDVWQRLFASKTFTGNIFEKKVIYKTRHSHQWRKIAAIFIGIIFFAGIALAAIRILSLKRKTPDVTDSKGVNQEQVLSPEQIPSSLTARETTDTITNMNDTAYTVFFDNASLDSILNVVASNNNTTVVFLDEETRHKKMIMTWQPDAPLDSFLDRLNAFDGLNLHLQNDTIVVEQIKEGEGMQ